MAEKKSDFQVVDKRKFTSEGEARPDVPEAPPESAEQANSMPGAVPPAGDSQARVAPAEAPPTHSQEDHDAGRQAYAMANEGMDSALKSAGIQDFQVSYERFMTQLFMTALYQLGMLREESTPARVDLVGARQTVDTIEMLVQKTQGNVSEAEARFVQDRLYELHMAYLEVTQAIARAGDANVKPPQG